MRKTLQTRAVVHYREFPSESDLNSSIRARTSVRLLRWGSSVGRFLENLALSGEVPFSSGRERKVIGRLDLVPGLPILLKLLEILDMLSNAGVPSEAIPYLG